MEVQHFKLILQVRNQKLNIYKQGEMFRWRELVNGILPVRHTKHFPRAPNILKRQILIKKRGGGKAKKEERKKGERGENEHKLKKVQT